jgi:hypothetical protein
MKRKDLKGSLTIEITLLMPFILGVFIFIIFSGFVLHDKCIVNKACLSAALRGSQESEDNKAVDKAAEAISEVLPGKLIGHWSYNTGIDVGQDVIRVTFEGDTEMGFGLIRRVLSTGGTSHSYECESYRLKEAEYIRTSRKSGVGYCL